MLSIDAMLTMLEFWMGCILGILGVILFVEGVWIKRDFRGRPMNRWHARSIVAQGVFTFALALHLALKPFDLQFLYRTALELPLLVVGLTSIGIMFYCLVRYENDVHPSTRNDSLN